MWSHSYPSLSVVFFCLFGRFVSFFVRNVSACKLSLSFCFGLLSSFSLSLFLPWSCACCFSPSCCPLSFLDSFLSLADTLTFALSLCFPFFFLSVFLALVTHIALARLPELSNIYLYIYSYKQVLTVCSIAAYLSQTDVTLTPCLFATLASEENGLGTITRLGYGY